MEVIGGAGRGEEVEKAKVFFFMLENNLAYVIVIYGETYVFSPFAQIQ